MTNEEQQFLLRLKQLIEKNHTDVVIAGFCRGYFESRKRERE